MRNEAGLSLMDYIVALAISAIIAVGAGAAIVQLFNITQSSQAHAALARQPQSLGYWISQDMMMAMTANTSDDPGTPETEFITMEWKEWESGAIYQSRYSWLASTGQQKKVIRKQKVWNVSGTLVNSTSSLIADNILSANISLPAANPKNLNVQAVSGNMSAARNYEFSSRPE